MDTKVIIPSTIEVEGTSYNVTTIDENAFSYSSYLTSVVIPSSVTTIGVSAFTYCLSLTIYCEASSQPIGWDSDWNYYSYRTVYWGITQEDIIEQNGIQYLIINDEAVITRYVGLDTKVIIPSTIEVEGTSYNVTTIGHNAFLYCSYLTSVIISSGVTIIEDGAFYNCHSLKNVVIPSSVTTIGTCAFYNCNSLKRIVIPSSVTTIETNAFSLCVSLTIYCEVESQPIGWSQLNIPVYWDGQWEYDGNGQPIPLN